MTFKTLFWKEKEWILAKVVGYKGATVQTKTIEEAKEALQDIMRTFIARRIKRGKNVKGNISFEDIKLLIKKYEPKDAIIGFIEVDGKLANKDFYKTVRTNVSIVNGYKQQAKKDGLNLSGFINDALEKFYG